WSAKQFTGSFDPPPLAYHSAQIVGDYMIIAFAPDATPEDSDQSNNHLPFNILLIAGIGGLLGLAAFLVLALLLEAS
ncbi:25854_t:CDS:2, partial [Racocetra persica]